MKSFQEFLSEGKKRGLWDNIHAKRKRGEPPAKKGSKDYPKTLNVEGADKKAYEKIKSKKTVKVKDAKIEIMPKVPQGPDKALGVKEDAPPGKKYERMVKHIKKSYAKDGKLTKDEKSIAYATAWKHKNK